MSDIQELLNLLLPEKQGWSEIRNDRRQEGLLKSSRLLDHETFIQRFKRKEAPATDAELIAAYICRCNQRAFDTLYKRYKAKMLAYIYAVVHDNDDGQDVLQIAWEKVLIAFKNGHYQENQDFSKWFKSICYREARLWNLEKQRFLHDIKYMPDKPDSSLTGEHLVINKESDLLLHKSIGCITDAERQVVIQHAIEGKSFNEVAVIMHIKASSVRGIFCRAAKKMRDYEKSHN